MARFGDESPALFNEPQATLAAAGFHPIDRAELDNSLAFRSKQGISINAPKRHDYEWCARRALLSNPRHGSGRGRERRRAGWRNLGR